ncbi:MAG TPA: MEDS domain-containing protein [Gemmatimonadaceae bacterium]|nr:MEDS domain-containing protein [Gemmatimonadaceae bacterium]
MHVAPPPVERRDTGISVLGRVPWSSHFSLFYETPADLLDIIVPFFEAGLRSNELCVWLPAQPELESAVADRLRERLPDFDDRRARGDMQFVGTDEFFRPEGTFSADAVLGRWEEFRERAYKEGFAGLRGAGDQSWVTSHDWREFSYFEDRLSALIATRPVILLCTYPLATHGAADILDSARAHHFVLAKRAGTWQTLETPTLKETKEAIERRNEELEQRVAERTRQLARASARQARAKRVARERTLEARFAAVLEERTRLAREIHDSLLQGVTGIALQLRATLPRLRSSAATSAIEGVVELAESTIRDARRAVWDMRAPALAQKGLASALEEAVRRTAGRVKLEFVITGKQRELRPEVEDTLFRIGQEATLNAVKHGKAKRISVSLTYKPRSVTLAITDNGRGFNVDQAFRAYSGHWGLLGMRERADRIGAALNIRSAAGRGTVVQLRVPIGRRASG